MTITSVTIIGPVAIPHRDSSANHAGGWLVGCVSSFGFASFYLTNFLLRIFHQWLSEVGREGGGVFAGVVVAGLAGASR